MKRLTKRQREMSQERFNSIVWQIGNIEAGIIRREASGNDNAIAELPGLRNRLKALVNLRDQAVIICETNDDMNIIAENSWS